VSKKLNIEEGTVIISRTDSIGDVLLTLPICAALKRDYPKIKIVFLASAYTIPVVKHCLAVDEIIDATELLNNPLAAQIEKFRGVNAVAIVHVFPNRTMAQLAKKAKIPYRIGTSHRAFHLLTCNHRVNFTRKSSADHEAQLNFHLLAPFGHSKFPTWEELNDNLTYFQAKQTNIPVEFQSEKKKVILHAKSQGSAVEWPLEKYGELADQLVKAGHSVYFTGTEREGHEIRKNITFSENIFDTSGKFSLEELISFINNGDCIVACSTGPLHIAGSLNKPCIGLFTPKKPMHPGRWQPLGKNSSIITAHNICNCKNKRKCTCLADISVDTVFHQILEKLKR
jgi:ADP-heptose:LPS heptosyltransferase